MGNDASVPIHVLVGRHDPSITQAVVRSSLAAPFPNIDVRTIESAGHYPIDEVPLFSAAIIERLLSE
jgi:pimeloyl-ACP methyl ester carboxylesterase